MSLLVLSENAASPAAPSAGKVNFYFKNDNVLYYMLDDGIEHAVVIPAVATQADQETATSLVTIVTPGRQKFNPSACKAWIRFSGDGTTINSHLGVSSLTDTGVGQWTVNFTTSFSSINYCAVTGCARAGFVVSLTPTVLAVGSCAFDALNVNTAALADTAASFAAFFGDV